MKSKMHRVALGGCSGAIHFYVLFNFLVYSYFLKIINFFALKKQISFSFSFVRVNGEQSQLLLQIRYQTEVRIAGRHSVSWNWSTLVLVGCLGLLKPLTLSQVSKTEWKTNGSSARYLVGPSEPRTFSEPLQQQWNHVSELEYCLRIYYRVWWIKTISIVLLYFLFYFLFCFLFYFHVKWKICNVVQYIYIFIFIEYEYIHIHRRCTCIRMHSISCSLATQSAQKFTHPCVVT